MLFLIDRLVEEHDLKGPFLDAGCGSGDVSLHFARRGWTGTAVDSSSEALAVAKAALAPHPAVSVRQEDLFALAVPPAQTVFLMDVIEHVKEDEAFLGKVSRLVAPGGHLVITVPVDPREWRWDDPFYGHYRRYEREALRALMKRSGLDVVSLWDCSFPLFWFMRRVFTRFFTQPVVEGTPEERTRISSQESAWDSPHASSFIDRFLQWSRLYLVHYPFRKRPWGCEALLVARKTASASA